jgi:rhodanese-related sulfurtransferase
VGEAQVGQREVVVYCHHGIRSRQGAAVLLAHGIVARSLSGGIDAWTTEIDPSLPRY